MKLLDPLFRAGECRAVFSDAAALQCMLDFEAALAHAEAAVGVIPSDAVDPIAAACHAELYDLDAIAHDAARAGNLAIPMVKHLTARVKDTDASAARYVHWGATSQDAIDTGFVLQLKRALSVVEADLQRLIVALARRTAEHRHTVMVGRTWMQHALPTTLGLKLAGTLDALLRHRQRLTELTPRVLALQFGGAAGTLASLGDAGMLVAERLAEQLQLTLPATPWHGQRDRVAEVAAWFGSLTGTLGKLARDVSLLMQTEIGEVAEPAGAGRGGSSTMPHKRNPVSSAVVLAAAQRVPALVGTVFSAMVQEHERGLGGWHAEWEVLPELIQLSAGALSVSAELVEGLEVHPDAMRANLDVTGGLIMAEAVTMALGEALGRLDAHKLVEEKCRQAQAEGRHLKTVLAEEPKITMHLSTAELERLLDPVNYTGVADTLIGRVLAAAEGD
ncbi:3-carboxy-cis,cis-muconate cycloisomerase [Crenobacter sp. SG2303]|uniref:3-carboxy-cis,cis-muconate cycloisomerase n=1 Tax=Crenobacter oryzisoli TaxID=3056844 RepID=A0ABT7XNN2_9NEIS|nr:3-carboxy-cis,cis-muconate cycloisomerase [Crenobacter sp. SG2303]MDN0075174.1 3-carboxy-cis,cis-muconate cycloisomerase [Crenobacter sp. SG2303]